MSGCLGDYALFRLLEGGGDGGRAGPVATCQRCTTRLRGFESAVGLAARAARGTRLGRRDAAAARAPDRPPAAHGDSSAGDRAGVVAGTCPGDEAAVSLPVQPASLSRVELSQALAVADATAQRPPTPTLPTSKRHSPPGGCASSTARISIHDATDDRSTLVFNGRAEITKITRTLLVTGAVIQVCASRPRFSTQPSSTTRRPVSSPGRARRPMGTFFTQRGY
jgi:hypothetical protein